MLGHKSCFDRGGDMKTLRLIVMNEIFPSSGLVLPVTVSLMTNSFTSHPRIHYVGAQVSVECLND